MSNFVFRLYVLSALSMIVGMIMGAGLMVEYVESNFKCTLSNDE